MIFQKKNCNLHFQNCFTFSMKITLRCTEPRRCKRYCRSLLEIICDNNDRKLEVINLKLSSFYCVIVHHRFLVLEDFLYQVECWDSRMSNSFIYLCALLITIFPTEMTHKRFVVFFAYGDCRETEERAWKGFYDFFLKKNFAPKWQNFKCPAIDEFW